MTDVTVKSLAAEIQTPWTARYSNLLMQGSLKTADDSVTATKNNLVSAPQL